MASKVMHLRDRRTGETFEIIVPAGWLPDVIYEVLRVAPHA